MSLAAVLTQATGDAATPEAGESWLSAVEPEPEAAAVAMPAARARAADSDQTAPPIVVSTHDDSAWGQFYRRITPFMPPVLQQRVASEPSDLSAFVVRTCASPAEGTVAILDVTYTLDDLSTHDALKAALERAGPAALWGHKATSGGETGEGHSVVSTGIGAAQASLTSRQPPVAAHVEYTAQDGATTRETVYLLPTLTGLQMKSAVIAALGLSGGFQDYYLRCDGDVFGSRTAIATHPGFKEGCLLTMEDVAGRAKAVGHT
eukprot:COSAG02_NODE_1230_length_13767_cov_16.238294_3_plen_262_part_00